MIQMISDASKVGLEQGSPNGDPWTNFILPVNEKFIY